MQLVGNQLPSMRPPLEGRCEGGGGRQGPGLVQLGMRQSSRPGLGVTQLGTR
jgi:hypothetical protein